MLKASPLLHIKKLLLLQKYELIDPICSTKIEAFCNVKLITKRMQQHYAMPVSIYYFYHSSYLTRQDHEWNSCRYYNEIFTIWI